MSSVKKSKTSKKSIKKKLAKVAKNAKKSISDGLTDKDLHVIVDSEIKDKTLVGHHINSFDRFTSVGITQIVTQLFTVEKTIPNKRDKTQEDKEIATIHFLVEFDDIKIERPTTQFYTSGKQNILMPNLARRHGLNYSAPLYVDATITATAYPHDGGEPKVRTEKVKNFRIASMPIMTNSNLCHLKGLSSEARKKVEEDHNDPGGYFIIKGGEWVISMIETRLYNNPHIFRNVGHEKEIARLEIISKPGDAYENSSELIMRYVSDGNIYLQFTSIPFLKVLQIPFYILFRLMGMTTDKEIIDNVVYGYSDKDNKDVVSDHMWQVLTTAFKAPDANFGPARYMTDQGRLLDYFAQQTSILHNASLSANSREMDENTIRYLKANILNKLDNYVLPHIGLASDSRHKKLRYLGHLIHKLLLVEYQIVPSTDRDSLKNKRINAAGRAYAKSLKTQFNLAIIQTIKKKLSKDFNNIPFSQVPLAQSFKSSIRGPDLERALIQAIVTGNKELTVKNRQIANRLSSETLHRKNQLNYLSTMSVIRTPSSSASKQDKRADEMRRVHPSYIGYICPVQSADTGEQVGMVKQRAVCASVTSASSSELLKAKILTDDEILPLEKIFPNQIHEHQLTKIMVNGDWIGCCYNSPRIVRKYREYRRGFDIKTGAHSSPRIDPLTTIYWEPSTNEINFWVDAGRMLRPVLAVRNNGELDPIGQTIFSKVKYDPFKNTGFVQDIMCDTKDIQDMLAGKKSVQDLHSAGKIDYISPEESENCYIAPSLKVLHENRHNPLHQYTHCEIAISLLGIPALTCPYANHNPGPRVAFQTKMAKASCGWYALNWPYRIDKHAFLQYYCEIPLVRTFANKYVYPNGVNAIVAIASYGGNNEEDSLYYCQSSADRGMYKGLHFNFVSTTLDKDEKFGNPDESFTMDIMKHANYEHLTNGFVRRGTMVKKDDVLIGKSIELPQSIDRYTHKDTSVLYKYNEPAMVETVVKARNQEDEEFCKVKVSNIRPLSVGQKLASRYGQKGVCGEGLLQSDMPFTESGIFPDFLLNPHAIPSRMTIGQLIESLVSKLNALFGMTIDASIFNGLDLHEVGQKLVEIGFNRYGNEQMYTGTSGEWIDTDIFIGPTYYQRILKFVEDQVYSVSTGPTCVITRQPLEGKANRGGLRIGEPFCLSGLVTNC